MILVVIVDNNGLQIDGDVAEVCSPYPIDKKFEAFNFHVIKINGQRVSSPFTIKAIGSQGLLYGSLTMIGGYLYILDEAGVIVETTQSDNLTVEKYTGVISYKYMKNEK